MKTLCILLLLTVTVMAQDVPCPLTVTKVNPASRRWPDGSPRDMSVEVRNDSSREVVVAQYELTYTDLMGHVTHVGNTETIVVHQSGHRTLMPNKKGTSYFTADMSHPHEQITARVIAVKYADGSTWESK